MCQCRASTRGQPTGQPEILGCPLHPHVASVGQSEQTAAAPAAKAEAPFGGRTRLGGTADQSAADESSEAKPKRKRSDSGAEGEGGAKGRVPVSAAVAKTQRRDYMREKRAEEAQQVRKSQLLVDSLAKDTASLESATLQLKREARELRKSLGLPAR